MTHFKSNMSLKLAKTYRNIAKFTSHDLEHLSQKMFAPLIFLALREVAAPIFPPKEKYPVRTPAKAGEAPTAWMNGFTTVAQFQ